MENNMIRHDVEKLAKENIIGSSIKMNDPAWNIDIHRKFIEKTIFNNAFFNEKVFAVLHVQQLLPQAKPH